MTGWIKLHRQIRTSDTFACLTYKQQLIAIYLILEANHEPGIWNDKLKGIQVEIQRGQLVTSPNKIVNEWFKGDKNFTRAIVRTSLARLEKLGFLTMSPTNNYTLITIENYSVYQAKENEDNQADNQVLTKSSPSLNQVLTTNKNVKNKKNKDKEKKIRPKVAPSDMDFENARLLFEGVSANYEKYKEPDFVKWGNVFRLIREQDKQIDDKLTKYLIQWSQNETFYKTIIHSAENFRKHYHSMYLKAKEEVDKQRHLRLVEGKGSNKHQEIERLRELYKNEDS